MLYEQWLSFSQVFVCLWRAKWCVWLNKTIKGRETITIKGREVNGLGTLFVSLLSLFSLYHFRTIRLDQLRKKKKKHGKKDQLIFTVSLFYLFFSPFLQNSFFFFFFFFLKICVCVYFLVGFNLWLFANTGLLGFDKERRFGSIFGIFGLHKKQRWEWVRATNREGWKTRDLILALKNSEFLLFNGTKSPFFIKT